MVAAQFVEMVLDNCPARQVGADPLRFAVRRESGDDLVVAVEVGKGRTIIELAMPPLEELELAIARGDRWFDDDLGDPAFDADHRIGTNDLALARWWMDGPARAAMRDARYSVLVKDQFKAGDPPRYRQDPRWWTLTIAGDRLQLAASDELDGSYVGLAITEAATIASRGERWLDSIRAPGIEALAFGLGRAFVRASDGSGHLVNLALTRRPFGPEHPCFGLIATSALDTRGGIVIARDDLESAWWSVLRASIDADPRRHPIAGDDPPDGFTVAAADGADPDALLPLIAHPAFAVEAPSVVRLRPGEVDLIWLAAHTPLDERTVRAAIDLRSALGGAPASGPYR